MACAVCAIPVNAQSGTISLNKSNVSMHTIMQEVEGQSDYTFFYNDNQIKLDKKVSVKAQNATIEQVLAQMFKNSGYTYKIVNNQIIVSKANAVAAVENNNSRGKESDRLCERWFGRAYHRCFCSRKGLRPMVRLPISMVTLH